MADPEFTAWCEEHGVVFNGIMAALVAEGWRGIVATKDLQADEVVLRVPERLLLTTRSAARDPDLITVLARHPQPLTPHQLLATHLLHEVSKGTRSFWGPYLRQIPRSYTSLPNFEEGDVGELQLQSARDLALQVEERTRADWRAALPVLQELGLPRRFTVFRAWRWAASTLHSRTMYLPWCDAGALVPYGDLHNYQPPPPARPMELNIDAGIEAELPRNGRQAGAADSAPAAADSSLVESEAGCAAERAPGRSAAQCETAWGLPNPCGGRAHVSPRGPCGAADCGHVEGHSNAAGAGAVAASSNVVPSGMHAPGHAAECRAADGSNCGASPPQVHGAEPDRIQSFQGQQHQQHQWQERQQRGGLGGPVQPDHLPSCPECLSSAAESGGQGVGAAGSPEPRASQTKPAGEAEGVSGIKVAPDCARSDGGDADGRERVGPGAGASSAICGDGQWDEAGKQYLIIVRKPYSRGEQVMLCYGCYTNLELLQHYGFVLEDNPHDTARLDPGLLPAPLPDSRNPMSAPMLLAADCFLHADGQPGWNLQAYLRYCAASPAERRTKRAELVAGERLSEEGDKTVLAWLHRACSQQLAGMGTPLEQDLRLASTQGPGSRPQAEAQPADHQASAVRESNRTQGEVGMSAAARQPAAIFPTAGAPRPESRSESAPCGIAAEALSAPGGTTDAEGAGSAGRARDASLSGLGHATGLTLATSTAAERKQTAAHAGLESTAARPAPDGPSSGRATATVSTSLSDGLTCADVALQWRILHKKVLVRAMRRAEAVLGPETWHEGGLGLGGPPKIDLDALIQSQRRRLRVSDV